MSSELRAVAARRARGWRVVLRPVRWIWRLPEEGLPDGLRFRLLSRFVAWRLAALLIGGGLVAGVPWVAVLALVPLVADQVVWRWLMPEPLRLAVRAARFAEEIQRMNANAGPRYQLDFDPELGLVGRVPPNDFQPAPPEFGPPRQAYPNAANGMWPRELTDYAKQRWLVSASIKWTGHSLSLVDGVGRLFQVAVDGPASDDRVGDPSARPAELVWVTERKLGAGVEEYSVLVVDASGRRLATMPALGFDVREVCVLAAAARLDCSVYYLSVPWELPGRGLVHRMFPLRRGHLHLRMS